MALPVTAGLTLGETVRIHRDRGNLHNAELAAGLNISTHQLSRLLADALELAYELGIALEEMTGMDRQLIRAARERGRHLKTATGLR